METHFFGWSVQNLSPSSFTRDSLSHPEIPDCSSLWSFNYISTMSSCSITFQPRLLVLTFSCLFSSLSQSYTPDKHLKVVQSYRANTHPLQVALVHKHYLRLGPWCYIMPNFKWIWHPKQKDLREKRQMMYPIPLHHYTPIFTKRNFNKVRENVFSWIIYPFFMTLLRSSKFYTIVTTFQIPLLWLSLPQIWKKGTKVLFVVCKASTQRYSTNPIPCVYGPMKQERPKRLSSITYVWHIN